MTAGRIRDGARDTKQVRLKIHLISNDGSNLLAPDETKDMPTLFHMTYSIGSFTVKLGIFQTLMA